MEREMKKDLEMEKSYRHADVESRLYEIWEREGYFHANPNSGKPPYCIVIPPPNITGKLHMGHALDETLQDALVRYKRMQGYETLWLPGTDHASIATEMKIVEQMASEGLTKQDIGREAFLKRAWEWREQYGMTIASQLRYLGSSCDWARERFTMDEGCNRAVLRVFVALYDKGLIYRGDRIINWCPTCKTALSDAEVEYEEQHSYLWHVRYDAPDNSYSITVATTRPETMLGDTAVAVHPEDTRYLALVGKTVFIPVVGREIPIIADEYCEMTFGTGAVKITPGHDPNDFEVAQRANLPVLRVLTDDGHISEDGGKYAGMDRLACREALVAELEACGNLIKREPYTHNVGVCYRCHATVEPIVSKQWFMSMKPLATPAIEAVREGRIRFVPARFEKTYFNWMENIRDWCISRQLWWGHRIPAWYCGACGETIVRETAPATCPSCGKAVLHQDEDVLDTWFSSGLWPFSTLGYPDDTDEIRRFYPTSTLVTGYDIIFFWVARMIVMGLEFMHEVPFDTVFVHGMVRDSQGRKMSKTLGNGIDPLEIIHTYGADPLRFSLLTGVSAGNDMRFYKEKVESAANFCNKVFNASRFVSMHAGKLPQTPIDPAMLELSDKWILHRLNQIIDEVSGNLDGYELGLATQKIYDFIWSEFCDWYIELIKPRLNDEQSEGIAVSVLLHVLGSCLKLLHPFMPFITEEIYTKLWPEPTIVLSAWPRRDNRFAYPAEAALMNGIMELIRAIRNLRAERKLPPGQRIEMHLLVGEGDKRAFCDMSQCIARLTGAEKLSVCTEEPPAKKGDIRIVSERADAIIPLASLVDIEAEIQRIRIEMDRLQAEETRHDEKLENESFISKAPERVVAEERRKLLLCREMLLKLSHQLQDYSAES